MLNIHRLNLHFFYMVVSDRRLAVVFPPVNLSLTNT
jgi:hypothetical protein